jgi:hypothetical protein
MARKHNVKHERTHGGYKRRLAKRGLTAAPRLEPLDALRRRQLRRGDVVSDFDRIPDPSMPRFSDPDNDPNWAAEDEPETPQQSAEIVDRNLRAMGSVGLETRDI